MIHLFQLSLHLDAESERIKINELAKEIVTPKNYHPQDNTDNIIRVQLTRGESQTFTSLPLKSILDKRASQLHRSPHPSTNSCV